MKFLSVLGLAALMGGCAHNSFEGLMKRGQFCSAFSMARENYMTHERLVASAQGCVNEMMGKNNFHRSYEALFVSAAAELPETEELARIAYLDSLTIGLPYRALMIASAKLSKKEVDRAFNKFVRNECVYTHDPVACVNSAIMRFHLDRDASPELIAFNAAMYERQFAVGMKIYEVFHIEHPVIPKSAMETLDWIWRERTDEQTSVLAELSIPKMMREYGVEGRIISEAAGAHFFSTAAMRNDWFSAALVAKHFSINRMQMVVALKRAIETETQIAADDRQINDLVERVGLATR